MRCAKVSLRPILLLTIHLSFFIVLNTSVRDSILKCLYLTNSFRYFKFKIVLEEPSFFSLVKIAETKSLGSLSHCTITPLSNSFSISEFIISFSFVLWYIFRTKIFTGLSLKSIFRPFF